MSNDTAMGFHTVTMADIEANRSAIESCAEDDRYIDGSGYGFEDFVDDVEKSMGAWDRPWDLGDDWSSPVIKELRKISRKVWKEMRESNV